jgi:phosphomannomutase
VFRTPVGEANVVETIEAVKAVIGGEGSNGGIIFPVVQLCRDSLKLMFPGGWIHVRSSNTEPLLRMAAEAKSNLLKSGPEGQPKNWTT